MEEKMKKFGWMIFLLIGFMLAGPLYAAEETEITTKEQLQAAIKKVGLKKAISMALKSGVLNGEQISTISFDAFPDGNPGTLAATLAESGVPPAAISTAAAAAGFSPGLIANGIKKGEKKRQEIASKEKEEKKTDETAEKEDGDKKTEETAGNEKGDKKTEETAGNEKETESGTSDSTEVAAGEQKETDSAQDSGSEQNTGTAQDTGAGQETGGTEPTTVAVNTPPADTGGLGFGEDVATRPEIPVTGPPAGVDPTADPVSNVSP
jgi:hypothetical protein